MSVKNESEYYRKAFKRLNETGKHTWNWAAFFLGSCWMLYREMYLYGILGNLICFLFLTFSSLYARLSLETENFLYICGCLLIYLGLSVFYGYFGNSLYYRVVIYRIKKGYHLIDKYSPTSIRTVMPEVLISSLFACCSTIFFALINFFRKPKNSELKESDTVVNEENITKYLEDKADHPFATFLIFLFLVALGTGTPNKSIFGNFDLLLSGFEPLSEYEEFETEKSTLLKTEKDLQDKELNQAVLTVFAPDILEMTYVSANNDNEFAENRLKSYNAVLSEYNEKLTSGNKHASEIKSINLRILNILRKMINERRTDITDYIVKRAGYNQDYVLSALDKVLKIDLESWNKSMLFIMETSKFKRKSEEYLELSKKGNVKAQSKLGRYYIKGFAVSSKGINFNGEEGLKWLKKASEQNDKTWSGYASARIAFVYMNGEAGIPQNYKEANKWFERAIKQGHYLSLYELALNYYEGIGVEKDTEKAVILLKQSIEKGDKRAEKLLNSIMSHRNI